MTTGWVIGAVLLGAAVGAAAAGLLIRRRDIGKVSYMTDALEDGELNFRFQEKNGLNRALNRLRTIFERQRAAQEQESWEKLIRVLTHEIMNTVSPIASLSEALSQSLDDEGRSELDVRAGLETISDSSKNLIKFVQTYRQLSGVARPVRQPVVLQEFMERIIALHREELAACGAVCRYVAHAAGTTVYADEGQLAQIFINLIKNALQAGAQQIVVSSRVEANKDLVIEVANNGRPISRQSQEQIFVPFFTTKSDGSGIGLSISRQIMRQHNGAIELLRSDAHETAFALIFR